VHRSSRRATGGQEGWSPSTESGLQACYRKAPHLRGFPIQPRIIEPVVSDSTEHFDRIAPRYGELRASPAYVDPVTDAVVELGSLRGCRVLDVGCGPGSVLRQLARSFEVDGVGIDASLKMIEVARRAAPQLEFRVGRAEDLPFGDSSFDAVVSRLVVHHLDRRQAFAEMRRVLRPTGRVVVTTTDPSGLETFWMRPYFPSYVEIERRRFPDGEVLRRELEEAGLGEVRVAPFVLERRFDRESALAKLRGRAYSTFALMSGEEYEAGVAAAASGLPDEVVYDLRLLNVVARRQ
jgi:ubiquinone/menaquinone biosynthesis C-methylase UbiE